MLNRKKPKVIWSFRRFGLGGSETFALSILPILKQHLDISLILTSGVGILARHARDMGITVHEAQMKGKLNRGRIRGGSRLIRSLAPDIMHIHSFDNHFMVRISSILAKVPVIITHHHTMPSERYKPELVKVEQRLLPATDRVIFVGNTACEQYWSMLKDEVKPKERERLVVMYDAFDIDGLRALAKEAEVEKVREQYGIRSASPVIGIVARIHPVKNLELLVEVLRRLKGKYPGIKCFVVGEGDGEYTKKICALADEKGISQNIIFAGFHKNVAAFFKLFDVTVLTSHVEGLPRSVIESYAVGTPVVCTDVGNVKEVLTPGKEGFLAKPGSADELVMHLDVLLSNTGLRHEMGELALRHSEEFDIKPFADRLLAMYDSLLDSPPESCAAAKRKYRIRYFFRRHP